MEIITSKNNSKVILARKLHDKKYRDQNSLYIFEGYKLFFEAWHCNLPIAYILLSQSGYQRYGAEIERAPYEFYVLHDDVYAKISLEGAPQGILCVGKYIDKINFSTTIEIENSDQKDRIFALENIQDPGNLGTMIRSAVAFGYDRLLLSGGCADVYHPRTIRASMGAVFKIRVDAVSDFPSSLKTLRDSGYEIYSAELRDYSKSLRQLKISERTIFVVGNEGSGITAETSAVSCGSVMIDIVNMESLNASAAASILMWESSKSFR